MNKRRNAVEGAGFARFFSAGSRSLKWMPPLNQLIVGNNNIPKGWMYAKTLVDDTESWIHFDGDPTAPKLPIPKLYKRVGVMAVEIAEMDALRAEYPNALDAVALRFKQAVVVGAFAANVRFDRSAEVGHELAATRIGHDDIEATLGLWEPGVKLFTAARSAQIREAVDAAAMRVTIPVA